ncbi:MAG: cytochrome c class [Gemmatimonadetes bacterium]|nr:cytochrome c class [Gemmatimonadota bacterium]
MASERQSAYARGVKTLSSATLFATAALVMATGIGASRFENPFADFVEPGFPFIVSTVDAGKLGAAFPQRNLAVRCVILMLGNDSYACFDTDLLRVAVAWKGDFVSLTTMAQISYQQAGNKNNAIPRVLGSPIVATGIYPGWTTAEPDFRDPRPAGPNPAAVGRGPIAPEQGRWNGLTVAGKEAVLAYTVAGVDIHEQVGSVTSADQVGITRSFQTSALTKPLTLVVAEVTAGGTVQAGGNTVMISWHDTTTAVGVAGAPTGARLQVDSGRFITLRIPAGAPASAFRVVAWRGVSSSRGVMNAMLAEPLHVADFGKPGAPHWPESVTTKGQTSPDSADYVLDRLTLPLANPWRRNVRVADIDFFRDGRAAVVTFEGDVWIVSGIDRTLQKIEWKRFASGLYEPLSLKVVRDTIHVYDRQGIVKLLDVNGDGEADVYENFSNLSHQSGESREFPLGMSAKPGGGFYLAIGSALDLGPKTSPAVMQGFRAGSSQSGTIQEISADGRSIRTFATGLREPIIGTDQRTGTIAASDQQGNFVPSTPIFLVRDGGYYGVPASAHTSTPPAPELPLVWIPHEVDQSGAGEVWVPGEKMGFGGDALVHLSYGRPGPFRVYIDSTPSAVQGALIALPGGYRAPTLKGRVGVTDGQLYLAGFSVWGSKATEVSSLVRLRYTGRPSTLPLAVHSGLQGILVRFATPLDAAAAADPAHYDLQRWNYVRSAEYGSGHFKLDGKPGQETLPLQAHLSQDGRTVLLVVSEMKPVMQMQLGYTLKSRAGAVLRDTLYLTVHAIDSLNLARAGFGALDWRADLRSATSKPMVVAKAASGATLYREKGCVGCHSLDGTLAGKTGPSFKGVYGSVVTLTTGAVRKADEAYLRRSMLDPAREIVRGFEPGMPSYRGVLTDAEIESLVRYIKTLGR